MALMSCSWPEALLRLVDIARARYRTGQVLMGAVAGLSAAGSPPALLIDPCSNALQPGSFQPFQQVPLVWGACPIHAGSRDPLQRIWELDFVRFN